MAGAPLEKTRWPRSRGKVENLSIDQVFAHLSGLPKLGGDAKLQVRSVDDRAILTQINDAVLSVEWHPYPVVGREIAIRGKD